MDGVKSPVAPQRAPFGSSQPCPGTGGPFPFLSEAPGSTSWRDSSWGYRNLPGGPAGAVEFCSRRFVQTVAPGHGAEWCWDLPREQGVAKKQLSGLGKPQATGPPPGGWGLGKSETTCMRSPPHPAMASVVWGTPLPWGQEVTRGLDMSERAEGHVLQLGVTQPLPAVCPGTSGEHGPWCPVTGGGVFLSLGPQAGSEHG